MDNKIMKQNGCNTQQIETATQKRENIKRICGILYVTSTPVIIIWAVIGLMLVVEDIWASLGMPLEASTIGTGRFAFEALLLGFEGSEVFIPIINIGWIPAGMDNVAITTIINIFALGLFLGLMLFIRSIFKDLKNGGSPFGKKVAWAAYGISLFLFFNALHSGRFDFQFIMLIPSALVALIGFIFDYGRILQEESDTTL